MIVFSYLLEWGHDDEKYIVFLGQKWSENDVMAEKRKQSESTESLDEGAFICIHFLYVYQGIKCLHVNVFFFASKFTPCNITEYL